MTLDSRIEHYHPVWAADLVEHAVVLLTMTLAACKASTRSTEQISA